MQGDARKLTFGAMMVAIFIVLTVMSVYIPLMGPIIALFIPLPIMLYRLRYDRSTSIFVLVVGILISMIGGILFLPAAFTFGVLGLVVGETIQQQKSKLYTFMAAGTSFLITTIMIYYAAMVLFGLNFVELFIEQIENSQERVMSYTMKMGELPEGFEAQISEAFHVALLIIPTAFILSIFLLAFIIISVNLPIAKRLGHQTPVFPPFRMMKLPVLTVWVYLIVILMPIFGTLETGGMGELVYTNASFLLRFLFLLQGISFIQHMVHEMKGKTWLSILLTIVALMLSPLTIIIGILDAGINLRAWVQKNNSK